jgi:three-Cys-motif partner protein
VLGDYTNLPNLQATLAKLPPNCLNLVFIDPTECDLPFATVQAIGRQLKNADLLINVAIGTDVNRNLVLAILDRGFAKAKSKYESFLASPGFCSRQDVIMLAKAGHHDDLRRLFMTEYTERLATEGYTFTDARPVEHYYHLVFASRSPKGLEFWQKACKIAPDNQRELL